MAKGGKRPGAGRPPGAVTRRSAEIRDRAIAEGLMPLDILLGDMRMYHNEGQQLLDQLRDRVVISPDELPEFEALVRKASSYKQIARECAEKAAPYLHPRLTSVDAKVKISNHEAALTELE